MVEPKPQPLPPVQPSSPQGGSELDGQSLFTPVSVNGGVKWGRGAALIVVIVGAVSWGLGWLEPLLDRASPKLCEVRGTVQYNGKPLTKGFVGTIYERGGLMGALGPIDTNGTFRLTTNGEPGAYSGRHRVTVLCMEGGFPPKSIIPERYTQPETSPFVIHVARTGSNNVQLELTDAQTP